MQQFDCISINILDVDGMMQEDAERTRRNARHIRGSCLAVLVKAFQALRAELSAGKDIDNTPRGFIRSSNGNCHDGQDLAAFSG
jgi:hypothetical protein